MVPKIIEVCFIFLLICKGTEPLPVKLNYVTLKARNDTNADLLTWLRGPANDEGYFTLQNPSSGKYLTRINNNIYDFFFNVKNMYIKLLY